MMRKKLKLLPAILLICMLWGGSAFAQSNVAGQVIDESTGNAISDVSVIVKGTTAGTVTDENGRFTLRAPSNGTLVLSFVGYQSKEVPVAGKSDLGAITLTAGDQSLNEVVVVGYTTQLKKDITGAVTVVDVGDMNKQPTGQLANQLQGQASGVTVLSSGQPGDEPIINIRGMNTFGSNTPLYVIDGVPTQDISTLNPNDVQSMQVLKDAGAASIYGSRASNGVIIITTKQGQGKVSVTYDGYYGRQTVKKGNVYNLLTPLEEGQLKWLMQKNTGSTPGDDVYGHGAEPVLPDYVFPVGAHEGDASVNPDLYNVNPLYTNPSELAGFYRITRGNKAGTDWFHEIFKPANMQNHNISVSGNTDQGRYYISGEYLDQDGIGLHTYLKRYSVRANTQFNLGKRVRIGENFSYSVSDNYRVNPDEDGQTGMAFRISRFIPVYDIMGNYGGTFGAGLGNARNPVGQADRRAYNNRNFTNRLLGNAFADIDILKELTFHTSFGLESFIGTSHSLELPEYENAENTSRNSYSESSFYNYNWTWTNTLQYRNTFGDHGITFLLGTESFKANGRSLSGQAFNYFSLDPNYVTLSTGQNGITNSSRNITETLWSQFGRLDYSFQDKYLLSATMRRDGSSKFISSNSFAWFPAVTLGWRISREDFMSNLDWLTDLRIRGGWGVMGNQFNIRAANPFTTFQSDQNTYFYDIGGTNNSIVEGFGAQLIGNPLAKWERDKNTNIGFDASLFAGKVTATFDWYKKDIIDLLFNPQLPATAGNGEPPYANVASMTNNGIDLSLGTHLSPSQDWTFDASINFTTYHNKIKKITSDQDFFGSKGDQGSRYTGIDLFRNAVGHPIAQFFGYKIIGFWNSQQEIDDANAQAQHATGNESVEYQDGIGLGRYRFEDINGDGIITPDDRTFIGDPNPDFTYGINLGASYKNFDLSAFFFGSKGNDIYNNVKWYTDFWGAFAGAKSKTVLYDSWRPDHQNAKVPIVENVQNVSNNGTPNSYFVEKGSYFRAKNITLGYTIPSNVTTRAFIQSLRVYVQAANVFTITNYSGVDPEVSSSEGASTTAFGVDEGAYPTPKIYTIGLNVKF